MTDADPTPADPAAPEVATPDPGAEATTSTPPATPAAAGDDPPHPDADPHDDPHDDPGEDATSRRRALAVAGPGRRPPPRRTGVFVDADDLRSHVGELLRAILGGYEVDAFGNFSFVHDGARVFVSIGATPVGLAVNVHAVTNVDLELDLGLATFIATTNHRLGFGALSWDADNHAVWLRHTLLGTTLDTPELQAAVATVARTAAAVDDQIKQRFGGRTFDEAPADVRNSTTPPTQGTAGDGQGGVDTGTDQAAVDNASGYL